MLCFIVVTGSKAAGRMPRQTRAARRSEAGLRKRRKPDGRIAAAGSVYIQRGAERLLAKQKQSRKRKESREPYDETGPCRGDAARKQHRHAIGKKEPPKKKRIGRSRKPNKTAERNTAMKHGAEYVQRSRRLSGRAQKRASASDATDSGTGGKMRDPASVPSDAPKSSPSGKTRRAGRARRKMRGAEIAASSR